MTHVEPNPSNIVLIGVLALLSLFLLVLEIFYEFNEIQWILVQGLDVTIALIFLGEFIYRLNRAPRTLEFLVYNWWQVLAAIPVTTLPTQALRGLQLLRVAQVLRFTGIGARLLMPLSPFFSFLYHTRIAPILSIFLFVFLVGSVVFHAAEVRVNEAITSYWDSVLFSASAVTTTGGTVGPESAVGGAASILLMFAGLITLGVFTAYVSSYLVNRSDDNEKKSAR